MAEARSAVAPLRIHEFEEGKDSWKDFICALRKSIKRRYYRTRNSIRNGLWPTSLWNLGAAWAVTLMLMYYEAQDTETLRNYLWSLESLLRLPDGCPTVIQAMLSSCVVAVLFFFVLMTVRRQLLRILLSYHGWMYEPPSRQSLWTLVWALAVKIISGYKPALYSCQRSLPRLAVPPLALTVSGLTESLRPLMDPEEHAALVRQADEFQKGVGPKLQRILVLKSWWSQNYVTDWWEKYVYLMSRAPTLINSNYYIVDYSYYIPTHNQLARASFLIAKLAEFKRLIDREQLEPLVIRGTIPICMAQYERAFATTRVPGEDADQLHHHDTKHSKHILVQRRGLYYKMDLLDVRGSMLTVENIQAQLQWIVDDADTIYKEVPEEERKLPALTTTDRGVWAKTFNKHFTSGTNKESFDVLNKAAFILVLSEDTPSSLSDKARRLLHMDGATLWLDKCVNMVVFSSGTMGCNHEHSLLDAPVYGHMMEYALTNEVLTAPYCDCGRLRQMSSTSVPQAKIHQRQVMRTPQRLRWTLDDDLPLCVRSAARLASLAVEDLDLVIADHDSYGKGFMKKCKVSPDAYIQMALQLAYYRDAGSKFALTYEASMTRLYHCGRTETVRSLTAHSCAFVRAMCDEGGTTKPSLAEKVALLRRAVQTHQHSYRAAMDGRGIDRHIFCLYVVSRGLGMESKFLGHALTLPWTLSTSQQPQQQMPNTPSCNEPAFGHMVSPGGGFGPVSDDGYGVSYMVPRDDKIFFHVSSKRSAACTDSQRFVERIFEALRDMRLMLEEHTAAAADTAAKMAAPMLEKNGHLGDGDTKKNA